MIHDRTYNLILNVVVEGPDDRQTLDAAIDSIVDNSTAREAIEAGIDGMSGWESVTTELHVGELPLFSTDDLGLIWDALAEYLEGDQRTPFDDQARELRKRIAYELAR